MRSYLGAERFVVALSIQRTSFHTGPQAIFSFEASDLLADQLVGSY
jgi:hypothetical protein